MADVYSTGLVFFEVVCEEEPFCDLNIHQMHQQVGQNGKKVSYINTKNGQTYWHISSRRNDVYDNVNDITTGGTGCVGCAE